MMKISPDFILRQVADSLPIYQRGVRMYENGAIMLHEAAPENGAFTYHIDGNYGDYTAGIRIGNDEVETECDCPYPGDGCKHIVAGLLDARDILDKWKAARIIDEQTIEQEPYLSPEQIRKLALEDRKKRAKSEEYRVVPGEMYKGEHLVENKIGMQYSVTLHDPANGEGHCSCPDFTTNRLGTCKHLIFLSEHFKKEKEFYTRLDKERFPFIDVYWDSVANKPRLFKDPNHGDLNGAGDLIRNLFDEQGGFIGTIPEDLMNLIQNSREHKELRVQESVLERLDRILTDLQTKELATQSLPDLSCIKTTLYPYQEEGVAFAVYRPAALIGDEMGLGKTLQAIALAILKKEIFDFKKVVVVTVASLKDQWKREIERFSDEKGAVVAGSPKQREAIYFGDESLFKITNYEAVLRDVTMLSRYRPDLIVLDEAQRIKNFSTKTATAIKRIPRRHALVLTGTPLENKLEDVYSIIQFLDPLMLAPLWKFAADHFMLSAHKKDKIMGYRNLDMLHDKLQSIVIRRRKEEVLPDLPDEVTNNYYIDLHADQYDIHAGYSKLLAPILSKRYLTPMDLRRIQVLLLKMRQVCNTTYLIDRETNISPKLKELEGILDELVIQNKRKAVIFSEWTTMTYLIGRHLSDAKIPFVELSGKVPVKKRQSLIDEFTNNPECKVFLSTDAGGTGLNLQAADAVINFELPWNPAKLRQRIGRVNRIGQTSNCINVVNLIAKQSIEERILAGIQLKTELFTGVFDGGVDMVEFSQDKRTELVNALRKMLDEEPVLEGGTLIPSEEIPEDTPHFLNPEVLKDEEPEVDVTAEEPMTSEAAEPSSADDGNILAQQPPEKIENVLNSGLSFIGGLMEMATGEKIAPVADEEKMVRIDRDTGEITMKFKLPGF